MGAVWMYYILHMQHKFDFQDFIVYLWSNYAFTIFGNMTALFFAITQIELLRVFSVIAPFWTSSKVSKLQWGTVVFHTIATAPSWVMAPAYWIHTRTYLLLFRWISLGTTAFFGCLSLFIVVQTIYLLYKIYEHFAESQRRAIELRIPVIRKFVTTTILLLGLDWTGIYLYLLQNEYFQFYAFEMLHIRVLLMVYIFLQLRIITLVKDEIFSTLQNKPVALEPLQIQTHKTSVYGASTLADYVNRVLRSNESTTPQASIPNLGSHRTLRQPTTTLR
jgi:hypothetical protein